MLGVLQELGWEPVNSITQNVTQNTPMYITEKKKKEKKTIYLKYNHI